MIRYIESKSASGEFGYSVAVFDNLAVIGAPMGDGKVPSSGVAFVYRLWSFLGNRLWVKVKTLIADDGDYNDHFGFSVDTNGEFIIVGAPFDGDNGILSGSAYMFAHNHGGEDNWGQVAKLMPNDPETMDYFGYSVALGYGDQFKTALVGAPNEEDGGDFSGAVYLFDEGIQIKKLTAPDGTGGESFGFSVDYTDNWFHWIVVGAPGCLFGSGKEGSAYLFERDWGGPNSWGFHGKITPSDGVDHNDFGRSVAISGDTVVIGSPGGPESAAYVFKPWFFMWAQVKKLMPTDNETYWDFGSSVAVEGDVVAVGASGAFGPGRGYVFKQNQGGTDNWGQYRRLGSSDGEDLDNLGHSIDISGSKIIVGAPYWSDRGAAYFFDLPATEGIRKATPWIPLLLLDD